MQTFKTSKSRENILARIRKSLATEKVAMPFPEVEKVNDAIYNLPSEGLEETFAEQFSKLGGKFVYCDNEQELADGIYSLYENRGWKQLLCSDPKLLQYLASHKLGFISDATPAAESADACITGCEMLVARTGSAILSSAQHMGRTASVFFPVHIIVAHTHQVVSDIEDAINTMKKKYGENLPSMINLNTGPSRTADIEKTLVVGVHGPGEVFVFLVNK